MVKRYLFTTSSCPRCPGIKEFLDEKGIEYTTLVVDKDKAARDAALNARVQSAPTLIEVECDENGDGKEIARYDSPEQIREVFDK